MQRGQKPDGNSITKGTLTGRTTVRVLNDELHVDIRTCKAQGVVGFILSIRWVTGFDMNTAFIRKAHGRIVGLFFYAALGSHDKFIL